MINSQKYLVYVFSRSQKDELQSFAGVFDLKKKRDICFSGPFGTESLFCPLNMCREFSFQGFFCK